MVNFNYVSQPSTGTSNVIQVVQIIVTDPEEHVPEETYPNYLKENAFRFVGTIAYIHAQCSNKYTKFARWRIKPTGGTFDNFDQCLATESASLTNDSHFTVFNKENNLGTFCSNCTN